MSLFFS